jgi:hypothetical protein
VPQCRLQLPPIISTHLFQKQTSLMWHQSLCR